MDWSQQSVIEEFRANGGKLGGFHADKDVLLLTTTGAHSGQRHVAPLTYFADGHRYVVAAAGGGGRAAHPDWYYNLVANPQVVIEVGEATFEATAVVVTDEERDDLFERIANRYPILLGYQASRPRRIPLVAFLPGPGRGDRLGRA